MSQQTENMLPHLGFRKLLPCKPLVDYIECYWFVNARTAFGYNEFLHPDGGMGVVFNYGDPLSFNGSVNIGESFLNGAYTRSTCLGLTGAINAIGVRFKPAGAHAFFLMPLNELKNGNILCADMGARGISSLFEKLAMASNDISKKKVIDETMLAMFDADRCASDVVKQSIAITAKYKGICPVTKIAEHLGVNQRKLERMFNRQLGLSPSEFSKSVRMEHARTYLKQRDTSYSDIVYNLGFYDQAHFVRQFKSVVGITPSKYRSRALATSALSTVVGEYH